MQAFFITPVILVKKAKQSLPAPDTAPIKKPNKGGLPAHVPTEQTRNLVALSMLNDMTHKQAAQLVGINEETLRKHYANELEHGKAQMLARVSANLYRIAQSQTDVKAALTASIFILKSKGGYNDRAAQTDVEVESMGPVRVRLKLGDRAETA